MRRLNNGFTLVELLVVVAIITLLIAILLPSLGKAREQARAVSCMSSLKQMGIGYQIYACEYNDYVVPHYVESDESLWSQNKAFRAIMNQRVYETPSENDEWSVNLLCPSSLARQSPPAGVVIGVSWSYGANGEHMRRPQYAPYNVTPYKTLQVIRSFAKLLVADSVSSTITMNKSGSYVGETAPPGMGWTYNGAAAYRHNNKSNVLFHDYHVETRERISIDASLGATAWKDWQYWSE